MRKVKLTSTSYFFLAFYSVGVDVCGVVFYGELFPNHLRSKGTSAAFTVVALADLVYLQATATAFENIGWKYFLVSILLSLPLIALRSCTRCWQHAGSTGPDLLRKRAQPETCSRFGSRASYCGHHPSEPRMSTLTKTRNRDHAHPSLTHSLAQNQHQSPIAYYSPTQAPS